MRYVMPMLLGLMVIATGCTPRVLRVDVQAAADASAKHAQFQRFAVVHQSATPARADWLATRTTRALDDYIARNQYQPHDRQPNLTATHDDHALLNQVGAMTRHALIARGYDWQPGDPRLLVSVDYCFGRRAFTVPAARGIDPTSGRKPAAYDATIFANAVAVYVYDAQRTDRPVWHGSIVHVGRENNFQAIAPVLLNELMGEFPYPGTELGPRVIELPR